MIGRLWRGWTTPANADTYQTLLEREVLPGIQQRAAGYRGVYVLRREDGDRVEFVTFTLWESIDALRDFLGEDYEVAYVPPEAREVLEEYDRRSQHFDVAITAQI